MRVGRRTVLEANAGAFAAVPPVVHHLVMYAADCGTAYPLRSRGSEFNQLAPQTPERLIAPRLCVAHQHHAARAPPVLACMDRHG